nr:MAG TPA: hypothetical protein [Caudoviricetes sp.]
MFIIKYFPRSWENRGKILYYNSSISVILTIVSRGSYFSSMISKQ